MSDQYRGADDTESGLFLAGLSLAELELLAGEPHGKIARVETFIDHRRRLVAGGPDLRPDDPDAVTGDY